MDPITLIVLIFAAGIAIVLLIFALRMFGGIILLLAGIAAFFWLWDAVDNPKQAEAQALSAVQSTVNFAHQVSDVVRGH